MVGIESDGSRERSCNWEMGLENMVEGTAMMGIKGDGRIDQMSRARKGKKYFGAAKVTCRRKVVE